MEFDLADNIFIKDTNNKVRETIRVRLRAVVATYEMYLLSGGRKHLRVFMKNNWFRFYILVNGCVRRTKFRRYIDSLSKFKYEEARGRLNGITTNRVE